MKFDSINGPYITGINYTGFPPRVEGIHALILLHQPHHVLEAILVIVAGITGEHGRPALSLDAEWLEPDNENVHKGMCKSTKQHWELVFVHEQVFGITLSVFTLQKYINIPL